MTKSDQPRTLGIGLIGTGFMGKAHALAFRTVGGVFPLDALPRLELLADVTSEQAADRARAFGFDRSTDDWQALINDPAVDIVSITTPNSLHAPISLAAIAAGKHVYCEKPLAASLEQARTMMTAAERAGIVTQVGFNYQRNPMVHTAQAMIASGELGEITGYYGQYIAGFMREPEGSFSWRFNDGEAGGALGDIGSHLISMSRFLLGDVQSLCGRLDTIHGTRTARDGSVHKVDIDDQAAMLVRFRNRPFTATLTTSWITTGREIGLSFEVVGTKGSLRFTQERFNELQFFKPGQTPRDCGYTTLTAGPAYSPYGEFCPGPGHQLGFNDLKVIEVKNLIDVICGKTAPITSFRDAFETARVMEAVHRSSSENRWVEMSDIID